MNLKAMRPQRNMYTEANIYRAVGRIRLSKLQTEKTPAGQYN